jgi:hypothetical protein
MNIEAELKLNPNQDSYINSESPTTNYGSLTYIQQYDRDGRNTRPVLSFDLSSIPAGAVIQTAKLSLYYYYYFSGAGAGEINPTGKTIWLNKLTRNDWHETQSTWNIYKTGNNWTSAGGDFTTTDRVSATYPADINNWIEFNVKDLLEDAIDNDINLNLLLKFETEEQPTNWSLTRLYSREYSTDTTLIPKLEIEYEIPLEELTPPINRIGLRIITPILRVLLENLNILSNNIGLKLHSPRFLKTRLKDIDKNSSTLTSVAKNSATLSSINKNSSNLKNIDKN